MKEAKACSADDVSVRLCFFVKVLKARGRRVAGGRMMGRIGAFGALTAKGFSGWAGVPKAGEEEGMAEDGGCWFLRNIGAGVLSILTIPRFPGKFASAMDLRNGCFNCELSGSLKVGCRGPRRRV